MMIGSYACVSKGKMHERAYEWENVWVSVMADRFQKFSENCKPAKLSLKKKEKKKTKKKVPKLSLRGKYCSKIKKIL